MTDLHGQLGPDGALTIFDGGHAETSDRIVGFAGYVHRRPDGGEEDLGERLVGADIRWRAGEEAEFHGAYAAIVYDKSSRAATLAHDMFGLKPFYYGRGSAGLVFGTNLRAVADRLGESRIDETYVADLLIRGEHIGPLTIYEGIRLIPPGWNLRICGDKFEFRRNWEFDTIEPLNARDEAEFDERFRALLFEAVRTSAGEGDRVFCELSGGLDSSSVLSVGCRVLDAKPESLSYVYSSSATADESRWIDLVVKHNRVMAHRIDADLYRPLSGTEPVATDIPSDVALRPKWQAQLRSLLRAEEANIVLTGEGGDAVLCGGLPEPVFLADDLRRGRLLALWRGAHDWAAGERGNRSRLFGLVEYALKPLYRHARSLPIAKPLSEEPAWLTDELIERFRRDRQPPHQLRFPTVASAQALQFVLRSARISAGFYEQLGTSASFRHPLFYPPLVRFMLSIPPDQKRRPGVDRVIQRRSLRGILPDDVRLRPDKGGSDQPWARGLSEPDGWLDWLCESPRLAARGFVNEQRWCAAIEQMAVGRCASLFHLGPALALEVWLRQQGEAGAACAAD